MSEQDLDDAWQGACRALARAHGLDEGLVSDEFFPIPRSMGPAVEAPSWLLKGVMTRMAFAWDPRTDVITLVRPEEWTADAFAALKPGGPGLVTGHGRTPD